ncbi:MAG: outer membrane protein transport protein [Azonexus sp.]|jgi:long-chain fatty acid transport protein|nr:outer membrane protein transport protein [Azonexus sp.]
MQTVITPRLIPILIAVAFSGSAAAAGFQLLEQNASGIGNAYAGSAAVAENASTVFYNPAGMTQLQGLQVSGGLSVVGTSFQFTDQGSTSTGFLTGTGSGGDGGDLGFIPNGYVSWQLNKDLYLGLGLGAPFGLKTSYDSQWVGAAQSTSFEVKTYNLNPSIAYRVNDTVSLGAGLNWQRVEATYKRLTAVSAAGVASPLKLTLDDDSWGWNVGALFNVTPQTKVGLSYRSKVRYSTKGDIVITGPLATNSSDAKASITLPDIATLSATHKLTDRVELLGDISWTGWSSIPKVDIVRASATLNGFFPAGSIAQVLDTDFRDTWRVALGANYKLNNEWLLKGGIAYDQTPVKGASTRLVSLPDNDRTWFSIGAQWKQSQNVTLDVGATYLYVSDTKIDNDQAAAGRGRITGTYEDSAWIFGAQVSMVF